MSSEKILISLKTNAWLFIALGFFIVWKFFLVSLLWDDRQILPVPDDALVYAAHLDGTINCPNFFSCNDRAINMDVFSGYDHLSYRLIFGSIAKAFHWDVFETFHYSFYIGTILLGLALFFFCKKLHPQAPFLSAFTLFVFTLFNGSGAFHGFYWIVPSFLAFLFFILLAGILVAENERFPWVVAGGITILGVFTHILFLYSLLIFGFYWLFYSLLTRKIQFQLFRKIAFLFIVAGMVYFPVEYHYYQKGVPSPYGPSEIATTLVKDVEVENKSILTSLQESLVLPENLFVGWQKINNNYFKWVFYNFSSYFAFFISLTVLLYFKQYKILGLYFGSLTLTLFSSLHIYGDRSLLFLWPLTFLFFGSGVWFLWKFIETNYQPDWYQKFLKTAVSVAFCFFVFLTLFYSVLWNAYTNQLLNISVTNETASYLVGIPKTETVFYSEKAYFLENFFHLQYPGQEPKRVLTLEEADHYVTINATTIKTDLEEQSSLFEDFFKIVRTFLAFKQGIVTNNYQELPETSNVQFVPEKVFQDINVYRIVKE